MGLLALIAFRAGASGSPGSLSVLSEGTKADGVADNTVAIQRTLDQAAGPSSPTTNLKPSRS